MAKRDSSIRYYCWIANCFDMIRWDCFPHKHDIYEFVPYAPFNLDYFSLRQDAEEELPAHMHPMQEPLTYEDCQNYLLGRQLTCNAGYHHSGVLYRRG